MCRFATVLINGYGITWGGTIGAVEPEVLVARLVALAALNAFPKSSMIAPYTVLLAIGTGPFGKMTAFQYRIWAEHNRALAAICRQAMQSESWPHDRMVLANRGAEFDRAAADNEQMAGIMARRGWWT